MTCIPMKSAELTAEDRFRELCRILATGLLRIRKQPHLGQQADPRALPDSGPTCLELPRRIALSVTTDG